MTAFQFRRGDTVRWSEVDYPMYVSVVTAEGVTTDSWSDINPVELALVAPVEDKYEALLDSIGHALKERAIS